MAFNKICKQRWVLAVTASIHQNSSFPSSEAYNRTALGMARWLGFVCFLSFCLDSYTIVLRYNSHKIQLFKVYNSVDLSIFSYTSITINFRTLLSLWKETCTHQQCVTRSDRCDGRRKDVRVFSLTEPARAQFTVLSPCHGDGAIPEVSLFQPASWSEGESGALMNQEGG